VAIALRRAGCHTPIIVMSAFGTSELRRAVGGLGNAAFLDEPLVPAPDGSRSLALPTTAGDVAPSAGGLPHKSLHHHLARNVALAAALLSCGRALSFSCV
jgi:hypothetical protein